MKYTVTDNLTKNLQRLYRHFPEATEKAATVAGLAIAQDAVDKAPTPPIDTGFLRGSWFVFVNGRLKQTGKDAGDVPGNMSSEHGKIDVKVGFNAEYAKYQHENLRPAGAQNNPGKTSQQAGDTGGFFLSSKLMRYARRYTEIFADRFMRNLK